MNSYNAWLKRKELNPTELKHFVQIMNIEIDNYKSVIRNYSVEKMNKYGTPYLNDLIKRKNDFESEFNRG